MATPRPQDRLLQPGRVEPMQASEWILLQRSGKRAALEDGSGPRNRRSSDTASRTCIRAPSSMERCITSGRRDGGSSGGLLSSVRVVRIRDCSRTCTIIEWPLSTCGTRPAGTERPDKRRPASPRASGSSRRLCAGRWRLRTCPDLEDRSPKEETMYARVATFKAIPRPSMTRSTWSKGRSNPEKLLRG